MNIEIPDFLLKMSQQMHEQNNRITANPIWQVRQKKFLTTESGINESHWELHDQEEFICLYHSEADCDFEQLFQYLLEYYPQWIVEWSRSCTSLDISITVDSNDQIDESSASDILDAFNASFDPDVVSLPSNICKLHMQEIEVVIESFLTEHDANDFIRRNQHNYSKLYTFVDSMDSYSQMCELRNWILSLTKK